MATLARIACFFVLIAFLARSLQEPLRENVSGFVGRNAAEVNILLLTAHPDDECMFFSPTILAIRHLVEYPNGPPMLNREPRLHSMCLSVGNADGLGDVRRNELSTSLEVLGILKDRRRLVDIPELQDDISSSWDESVIAQVLEPYVIQNNITDIMTFDSRGISDHPNHKSLPRGVLHLISTFQQKHPNTPTPRLFTLLSHTLADKYIGPLAPLLAKFDILAGGLLQRYGFVSQSTSGLPVFVAGVHEYRQAFGAMMQHKSQLVWFRWLYMLFSRYMWVNEWVELVPPS
ncbi:putative deacetylase LmbE-like domain-containing protein [Cytidiella melzeri]|nr:putative deacetylase LmbE-like domain-containing protein [Cytidiella melzeri]